MIRNYFVLSILAGGIFLVAATPLLAENGALDKMYGNGVHAFFSSDYAKAHECLSRAIDAKSKDPRCFYFRGLAYLKLGREPEARSDFAAAADLEAVDAYKFYNVSKALQRVQGKSRTVVEQYRAKARLKAAAREAKLRRARYEELRATEARILQQQAKATPAKATPAKAIEPSDPFTAGPIEEDEAPKTAAKPSAKSTDIFADAPAEPVEPKKSAAKPPVAKKGGGILGAIGKAVGKTTKSKLPKLGGKKAGQDLMPAVDNDDPFGGDPFGGGDAPAAKAKKLAPKAKKPAPKAKKPAPKAKKPEPKDSSVEPVDPDDPFG